MRNPDSSATAPPRARIHCLIATAAILTFAALMHWPVLLDGKTVSAFDLAYAFGAYADARPAGFTVPQNRLLTDPVVQFQAWDLAMFDGPLPFPHLWNPYAGCGSPLLANSQCAPFFPLKQLLYPLFGVRRGFGFLCLAKMALAGLFMWSYLRTLRLDRIASTLGALSFMACGFMIAWLQYPHTNVALLLPLLFLGCEHLAGNNYRAGVALVVLAVGLGALGGHPETLAHIVFAAGLYLLLRTTCVSPAMTPSTRPAMLRPLLGFTVAVLAGAVLGAVQLLPTLEYIANSDALASRTALTHATAPIRAAYSAPDIHAAANELLTYLLPNTFGNPAHHNHWWNAASNYNESAGYVGIGVLLLALFAWRYLRRSPPARALVALQLISLAFVLNLPLIVNTLGQIPPLNVAANKRFLLVFCFCNASLAATALHEWRKARTWSLADALWLALLAASMSWAAGARFVSTFSHHRERWIQAYGRESLAHFAIFLLLTLAALLLMRLHKHARLATSAALLLIVFTAADLYRIHFAYNPFTDPASLYPQTPAITFLQTQQHPRVLPVGTHLGPNILALHGLDDPRLYDAVSYAPYAQVLISMQAKPDWNIIDQPPSALSSIAGVRFLWGPRNFSPAHGNTTLAYEDATQRIYEDQDARPHAYLVSTWTAVASPGQARARLLAAPTGDGVVAIEPDRGNACLAPVEAIPSLLRAASVLPISPTQTRVALPDRDGGLLVLNDVYYPGWTARIDGQPAPLYRANGAFRGVPIPPGTTTVDFFYAPPSFKLGACLSFAMLGTLLLLIPRWCLRATTAETTVSAPQMEPAVPAGRIPQNRSFVVRPSGPIRTDRRIPPPSRACTSPPKPAP